MFSVFVLYSDVFMHALPIHFITLNGIFACDSVSECENTSKTRVCVVACDNV